MHSSLRLTLATSLALLAACATTSQSPPKEAPPASDAAATGSAPTQIPPRAIARWEHLIARRADLAWDYLSPGYRETHPRDEYAKAMNERPVQWYQVSVYEPGEGEPPALECANPRSCTLMLKVDFKVRSTLVGVGTLDSWNVVKEHWVNVRDQWYVVPEDVVR
jgi:hypothetical protein